MDSIIPIQNLLTLPPAMARDYLALENRSSPEWFATSDPAGLKLGSGGANRIRRILTDRPPNAKARFVSFQVSNTGLQLTRS